MGNTQEHLEKRLSAILTSVGGRVAGADGRALWFTTETTGALEIRLAADPEVRSYARSATFGISHGGQPTEQRPPAAFEAVVAQIQSLDTEPVPEAAQAFADVARRVALLHGVWPADQAAMLHGGKSADGTAWVPSARRWERAATRELNVIFLDLCAALIGGSRRGQALIPLHWGFWATPPTAGAAGSEDDPFEAFSMNLLSYVPEGATRIMDVGCGLGGNARLLAARGKQVTAVTPVPHHCETIAAAGVPGIEARCVRFDELEPAPCYDLLLFSESVNHFPLEEDFFHHCRRFLVPSGYLLLADELSEERIDRIQSQRVFRLLRSADITANVAPTFDWWLQRQRDFAAYRTALFAVLERTDPALATRVREVLDGIDSDELRQLFSGRVEPLTAKGRYMIFLLQAAEAA